jgi:TPR repeat protein
MGEWDRAKSAHERGDYAAEVAIVRPLAEKGHAFAQFNLGVLYDRGQGRTAG